MRKKKSVKSTGICVYLGSRLHASTMSNDRSMSCIIVRYLNRKANNSSTDFLVVDSKYATCVIVYYKIRHEAMAAYS